MVAAQAVFQGATANLNDPIAALNCCSYLALARAQMIGFQDFSPLLAYCQIKKLDDRGMDDGCKPFTVSSFRKPGAMMEYDPCTRTRHEPREKAGETRYGKVRTFMDSTFQTDLSRVCCEGGLLDPRAVGEYLAAHIRFILDEFVTTADLVILEALNSPVAVDRSSTGFAKGARNGLVVTPDQDGIVTVNATAKGMTYEVVEEVLTLLSDRQANSGDVLFVVPYGAIATFRNDAKASEILTEESFFGGMRMTRLAGNSFYTTSSPSTFFKEQDGVTVRNSDGTTTSVDDVIIGYAIPRDSILFAYVNHAIPQVSGIMNTTGVAPAALTPMGIENNLISEIYSGADFGPDITTMFKMRADENPFPYLMGLNTRTEAAIGAIRAREGALVKIALPKSTLTTIS